MLQGRTRKDGITLIALIVTIVILLILSTVTVMEVRETALFGRAKDGAKRYKVAQIDEQNKMDKWANNVDIWANMDNASEGGSTKPDTKPEEKPKDPEQEKPKPTRKEITNDLEIGDYVIYNVKYIDACKIDTNFTENNGWRVISPGNKYNDNTYDNVEIIPTGVPMRLYYHRDKIDNYPWKGTAEEIKKFKSTCNYVATDGNDSGVKAALGLKYHFDKINILESDPGGNLSSGTGGFATGDGYRVKISKVTKTGTEEIKGNKGIAELIVLPEVAQGVKCPDLEIVKETMNKKTGGRTFEKNTDKDVLKPNNKFKTEDDAAKGFWNLQDLKIGKYLPVYGGFAYWIASPYSPDGDYLRSMTYAHRDGCFHCYYNDTNGLRPIVSLKSNIKLQKSTFQGN